MKSSILLRSHALQALEKKLGHYFKSPAILDQALTHTSWANEHTACDEHNERLEFLGDAVLELCVSDELFHRFPLAREGAMTEMRSRLVSEPVLAAISRSLGLDNLIRLGIGEERQDGRNKDSLLADAFEAVLAAVYEDGGFVECKKVIAEIYADLWPAQISPPKEKDPKSRLQEECQKRYRQLPVYTLFAANGPDHARVFNVKLALPDGREFAGTDSSAKKAGQAAAAAALANF